MSGIVWREEERHVTELAGYQRNPRRISKPQFEALKADIEKLGYHNPIAIQPNGEIISGHQRCKALKELGHKTIRVIVPSRPLTDDEYRQMLIQSNLQRGDFDMDMLANDFDVEELLDWGFDPNDLPSFEEEAEKATEEVNSGALAERFGVPPFTVLNAREGWWQDRKRAWLALGIESEKGREQLATTVVATDWMKRGNDSGGSVFDPVLCELAYKWFCPEGGTVLDPFAGGSVRGVVASKLGRQYVGVELRSEQVEANRVQATTICAEEAMQPVWVQGDSRGIQKLAEGVEADLLFTCPPYADLEVYSDDKADLSTLEYAEFKKAYEEILTKASGLLKPNAFACIVVGEVRDGKGMYYNFVGDTVVALQNAGLSYYNEAILVTPVGSLPLRAGRQFEASRKLGKTHQNVLVFVKGDPKKAVAKLGAPEFGEVKAEEG